MAHTLKLRRSLAALAVLFISPLLAQGRTWEVSAALGGDVLKVFADSTKEMDIKGVPIRGHEIGNGKFRTCEGKVRDIGNNPLRKSDRCRQPSGTHTVKQLSGEIMGFAAERSTVTIKVDTGKLVEMFVPSSTRLVTSGRLDKSRTRSLSGTNVKGRRITVYFVIPERVEAVATDW